MTFCGPADFVSTTFSGVAAFDNATFSDNACFNHVTFSSDARFNSVEFAGKVNFDKAEFHGSSNFNSAKFEAATDFRDATFLTAAPKFHAAEIYDDTVFSTREQDQGNWPPLTGEGVMPAADQKRAYNRLRLFMNRSLQIDEEQFFHRMEMRCKKEMAQGVHKWIYAAFEILSDFGISVKCPVAGLAVSIFIGTVVLMLYLGMDGRVADGSVFWESLGWSVSNTVPFLGYGKLYYGAEYVECYHWAIKAMAGVQTLMGYVLLFFLGLGLRNRFRLR